MLRSCPSIVIRIWGWGVECIAKSSDYLYGTWPQIFCVVFGFLIIARIVNFLTIITGIIVSVLTYEQIKQKWFTKNPIDISDRVMNFYPNNWILSGVEFLIALILFCSSILLVLGWTILLICLLVSTFPWCLLLLLL